jgi:hypothetical protein
VDQSLAGQVLFLAHSKMYGVGSCACLALGFIAGIVIALAITWRTFKRRVLPVATVPDAYKTQADAVEAYVNSTADALVSSGSNLVGLDTDDVATAIDAVPAAAASLNTYLFAYNAFGLHIGRLIYHGSTTGWCSSTDSTCSGSAVVGDNYWDYQALNMQYSVRDWCDIATQAESGWVAYYWKDGTAIAPKYTYIKRVPSSDFFICAGFSP